MARKADSPGESAWHTPCIRLAPGGKTSTTRSARAALICLRSPAPGGHRRRRFLHQLGPALEAGLALAPELGRDHRIPDVALAPAGERRQHRLELAPFRR